MTMHLDQTLSKFIPGSISPQVKIGPTTVLIAGSSEKKAVPLTFVINLNEAFFLFQQDVFLEWNFRNPSALISMKNTGTMRRRN